MTLGNDGTSHGTAALTNDALMALTGSGAAQFLQDQTTADFDKLSSMAVIPGAFCDLKGRVIADFLALAVNPEHILLRTDRSLVPVLMAHTQKYLMFTKADLTPLDWIVTGAWGEAATTLPGHHDGSFPDACAHETGSDAEFVIYHSQTMAEVWSATAQPADSQENQWRALRIATGEARVTAATSGKYLPQDLNYDLRQWVSFDKGCYMGQEIIARLHWRGTPKRRLYAASAATGNCPEPGTTLTLQGSDSALGSVVNACRWREGALLAIETTEDGIARGLQLPDGTPIVSADEGLLR